MSLTRDATGLLDTSFERESGLILEVTVIRAENLKAMDANGLSGTCIINTPTHPLPLLQRYL